MFYSQIYKHELYDEHMQKINDPYIQKPYLAKQVHNYAHYDNIHHSK